MWAMVLCLLVSESTLEQIRQEGCLDPPKAIRLRFPGAQLREPPYLASRFQGKNFFELLVAIGRREVDASKLEIAAIAKACELDTVENRMFSWSDLASAGYVMALREAGLDANLVTPRRVDGLPEAFQIIWE
jgi:hypothetical protein